VGTFGGALEARGIDASDGRLTAEVHGEVEKEEDGVLVLRRIHVKYKLEAEPEHAETIDRVHGFHADKCPVYRSLKKSIAITTALDVVEAG